MSPCCSRAANRKEDTRKLECYIVEKLQENVTKQRRQKVLCQLGKLRTLSELTCESYMYPRSRNKLTVEIDVIVTMELTSKMKKVSKPAKSKQINTSQ